MAKYYDWKTAIAVVLGVSLVVTFADRGSVELFKEVFQRLRPSRNPLLEGQVNLVTNFDGEIYRGGKYGFVSSHASNYFGLATYFALILGKFNRKWWFWMMLWALVVSYTRIYLGVHYPGDIFVGALFGMLCGLVAFLIARFVINRIPNLKNL
jgi:undecaprenyl-diphosphatase